MATDSSRLTALRPAAPAKLRAQADDILGGAANGEFGHDDGLAEDMQRRLNLGNGEVSSGCRCCSARAAARDGPAALLGSCGAAFGRALRLAAAVSPMRRGALGLMRR